jgi:SAM-dependent methyltransferase
LAQRLTLEGWFVINVDIDARKLMLKRHTCNLCARAEALPLASDAVDVVTVVSATQYMDQKEIFDEFFRVLKPGGLLLLHENGPFSPIIAMVRAVRLLMGLGSARWRSYNRSIRRYLRPERIEADRRWVVKRHEYGLLLGALVAVVDDASRERQWGTKYLNWLVGLDSLILRAAPGLRRLCWLNCFTLVKRVGADDECATVLRQ